MKRLGLLPVLALMLAVAPGVLAADSIEIVSVDATAAPEVSVVVALPADVVAASPTAADFAVVVDGIRVDADVYALVRDAMEVVVVMDVSGSMEGEPLDQARVAAIAFVNRLPDTARIGVVAFGSRAEVLAPVGADRSVVTAAIGGLIAQGDTALYDAVVTATELFTAADSRHVLIVLSDGGDTASSASLDEARAAVVAAGVELHAVALQTAETAPSALQTLAAGAVTTAADADGLAGAYEAVAAELTGRYRLRFNTPATGVVTIDVFVNGPDGVLSASRRLDVATGSVIGTSDPVQPPEDFGAPPPPVATIATPSRLGEQWTLPAGIAMVFLGAVITLWLTSRGERSEDAVSFPLESVVAFAPAPRTGLLARAGRGAKALGDRVARRSRRGGIDSALERAGLAIRPGEFVVVAATAVVVGVTSGLVLAGLFGAVLFGGLAALLPRAILGMLARRRRRAFGDQLEGTLQTIAGSLRAGYGLVQAIATVAAESPAPTSEEFNRVVVENRLGRALEESLRAMAQRLDDEDLGWVVEAIEIQREVGGNLAEVLDTVTGTIRDRNMIRRQIRALSAEGRLSAYILVGLPFAIAGLIATISPDYLAELTDTGIGKIMLAGAAALMLAGSLWIRKIVRVEF